MPEKETVAQRRLREIKERNAERSQQLLRIHELKRRGMTNVAIGKQLGISESTIRRRLQAPITDEDKLIETMRDALEHSRDWTILAVTEEQAYERLFGEVNDARILRVHTEARRVSVDMDARKMSFHLEFSVSVVNVQATSGPKIIESTL